MANLTRWDPFGSFSAFTPLRQAMSQLMQDAWIRPGGVWTEGPGLAAEQIGSVACDLYETDDAFVLTAPLPGLEPEDVEISVQGNLLTISGELKPAESEREQQSYHVRERRYGKFFRQISLPASIEGDRIQARLEQGVLTLHIPKAEELKPRRIPIQPRAASGAASQVTSGEQRQVPRSEHTYQVPIDAEIYTSDGERLGTVREVEGQSFKVDAPLQPDYWLPMDCVESVSGNRVRLNFAKDRLGNYKTGAPRAA